MGTDTSLLKTVTKTVTGVFTGTEVLIWKVANATARKAVFERKLTLIAFKCFG